MLDKLALRRWLHREGPARDYGNRCARYYKERMQVALRAASQRAIQEQLPDIVLGETPAAAPTIVAQSRVPMHEGMHTFVRALLKKAR